MKKVVLFVILFNLILLPVYAKDNKLYFTEKDNRIYYESSLLDENVFMKHTDMTPGNLFRDELLIENGTNTKYTLYFKVVPREQSEEADKLLESINMKIFLDDSLIYEGKSTGLDSSINLQNAVMLGEFIPSKESKLVVETSLSEDYDNTDFNELSYIDWEFYAQYDDNTTLIVPDTGIDYTYKRNVSVITVVASLVIVISLIGIIYTYKKNN